MKKIILILTVILLAVLAVFLGWYFLARNSEVPLGEAIRDVLPFGSGGNAQFANNDPQLILGIGDQSIPDEFASPTADLFRVANTPVAGAVVLEKGNQTIVRYVDRATGHIYDVDLATLAKTRVTNQTLPKIYEAYFRPDGNAVLLRSLKNNSDVVENLSLALTPPQATSSGAFYAVLSTALRGDIDAVSVGSGNTLIYALRDTSMIVTSTFNGTGARTLLTSPFTDWRLASAGNSLVVYTKASANAPGYAYLLNTSSGAFTKILGPLNGLIAMPDTSGNRVLYSYVEDNGTRLLVENLASKTFTEILPVTLAEKCVWSAKNAGILFCAAPTDSLKSGEPDGWYKGATHFSDRLWLFDTNADIAQVLVEPKPTLGVDIDAIELKFSSDEDYLVFTNKNDLSLWAFKLK